MRTCPIIAQRHQTWTDTGINRVVGPEQNGASGGRVSRSVSPPIDAGRIESVQAGSTGKKDVSFSIDREAVNLIVRCGINPFQTAFRIKRVEVLRLPGSRDHRAVGAREAQRVELAGENPPDDYNRCLLEETCATAARRSRDLHLGQVFHVRPLRRSVAAAALLTSSVVLFAVTAPKALGVWFDRAVLLSDVLWPRQTHLVVDGFDESRVAKVARGANFDLRVKAELIGEGEAQHRIAPQLVEVCSRTDGGARDRKPMDRDGVADIARGDRYQRYSYNFRAMLTSLVFDVVGGDDRVSNLRLEVVDNPAIVAMAAAVGRFTLVEGQVDVLHHGKVPAVAAKLNDGVEAGDVIRTKPRWCSPRCRT